MLEIIFQGFLEWAYSLVLEIWEFFSTSMLNLMSMDFAYLESHIPILPVIQQIMLAVGWALLIGNLVFQSIRSMLTGLGFEAEDPKLLFTRTFVFSFLLLASPQICKIALNFTGAVIRLLEIPNAVIITTLNEGMFAGLGTAWVLVIICGLVVMYQSIKLFVEMVERYFILSMLTITSPLAFGMGGSKSTSGIFSGWCKMYGSMCLLMVLNVVFVKILLSVLAYSPFGVDVLPWMALIMAVVRTAKKADSIVTRIGLNPAITNEPRFPGVLSMIVARTMMSGVAKVNSQNGTNGGQRSGTRRGGPAPGSASGNRGSSGAGGQNGGAGRNGNAGRNGGAGNSGTHTNPAGSGTQNPSGTSTNRANTNGTSNAAGNGGHTPDNHNTPPDASGNNSSSQSSGGRGRRRGGRGGVQSNGVQGRNRQTNGSQGGGQRQNRSTDSGSPNGTTRQDSVYSTQSSSHNTNSASSQNNAAHHSTASAHSAGPADNRQSSGNVQNQDEQRTRRTSVPPGERRSPVYTTPETASGPNFSGTPRDAGGQAGNAPSENSATAETERKESRYSGRQRDEEAKARRDEAPTTLSAERDEKQAKSGISASRFTNRTGTEQSSHAHSSLTNESHTQDGHTRDGHTHDDTGQRNTPKMAADIPAASTSGDADAAPKPTRFPNRPHEEGSSKKSSQTPPTGQTPPASASATGEQRTENGTTSTRFTGRTNAAHDNRTQNRQAQSSIGQAAHKQDYQAQGSHTQNNQAQDGHAPTSQKRSEKGTTGQTRMSSGASAVFPKAVEDSNRRASGKDDTSEGTTENTRFTHTGGNVPNTTEKTHGTSPTGTAASVDSTTRHNRTAAGPAAVLSGQEKAEQHTETRFTSRPDSSGDKQSPQESRNETASPGTGPAKAGITAGNITAGARTTAQVTAKTATNVTGESTAETTTRATTRPTGTAAGNAPSASFVTGRSGTEKPAAYQTSDSGEKSGTAKPGAISKQTIPAVGPDVRSGSPTGTAGTGNPSEAGKQGETRFTSVHKDAAPQGTSAGSTIPGSTVPGGAVSRNDAHSGNPAVHAPSIAPSNTTSGSTDRKTVDTSVKGADSSGTAATSTRFTNNLPGAVPRSSLDGTKSGTEVPRSPETHAGGVNIGAQTVPSGKAGETRQNDTRMTQRDTRTDNQSEHKDNRMSERDTRTAQQDTRSSQRDSHTSLRTEADASRNHAMPPAKTTPHNKADTPRPGTAGTGTSLDTRQTVRPSGSEVNHETRQSMEAGRIPAISPIPANTGNSTVMRSDASTLRTESRTDSSTSRFTSVPGAHTAESVSAARDGTVSMSHPSESSLRPASAVPGSPAGALHPAVSSRLEQGSPSRDAVSKPGVPGSSGQGSPEKDAAAGSVGNSLGTPPTPRSGTAESRRFSDYRQTGREQSQVTKTESGVSSAGVMQSPVRVTSSPQSGGTDAPSRPVRPSVAGQVSSTDAHHMTQQTAERRDSVPMPTHEHGSTAAPQSTQIPRPDKGQQESVKVPDSNGKGVNNTQTGSSGVNLHIPIPNATGGAAALRPSADRPARGEYPANQGTSSERTGPATVMGQRPVPAQQEHSQEHPARREHPNANHPAKAEIAANSVRTEAASIPARPESSMTVSTESHSPRSSGPATGPTVMRTAAAGRQETPTSYSSSLSPRQVETGQRGQSRTSGLAVVPEAGQNAAGPVPIQQAKGSTAPPVRNTAAVSVTRQTMRGNEGTINAHSVVSQPVSQPQAATVNAAQRPVPAQPERNAAPQGHSMPPRPPQYSGQGVYSGTAGTAPNPIERNPRSINGTPAARNGGAQQNQDRQRPNPAGRSTGGTGNAGATGRSNGVAIGGPQKGSPQNGNPVQRQNPQSERKRRQQSSGDEKKPLFGLFSFGKNQTTRQSGRNQNNGGNPNRNVRG